MRGVFFRTVLVPILALALAAPGCEESPHRPEGVGAHDPIPPAPPNSAALATAAVLRGAYAGHRVVADSVRVIPGGDPVSTPVATLLGDRSVPLNLACLRGEGRSVVVGLLEADGGNGRDRWPFLVYLSGPDVLNVDVLDP